MLAAGTRRTAPYRGAMVPRRLLVFALVVVVAALAGRGALTGAVEEVRDAAGLGGADGPRIARVTHVRDGDTFEARIRGELQVVRLLGIDTPESVRPGTPVECGALEAKDLLLRMLFTRPRDTDGDDLVDRDGGRGRRVVLERDPTQDDADRYGRVIRYARVRGAERTVQERVLAAGWAAVYVFRQRRFERFDAFVSAARKAKRARRGVYRSCRGDFHRPARR